MAGRMQPLFPGFFLTPIGGGGGTISTPTGTVNGSNTSFTVTAVPLFIVSDGIVYFENFGFSITGLAITMTIPPSQYIRILA